MRILLTGNNGYIGTVMAMELGKLGHEVVGLDTNYFEDCAIAPLIAIPQLHKDIRDVTVKDLVGFDSVIHLAGLSNDHMGNIDENLTYEINQEASLYLATMAMLAGADRFLFASSSSVYGDGRGEDFCDETSIPNPLTAYAKSKLEVEEQVAFLADSNFSPTFLRNATVFGFSPRLRNDLVVNTMVAHAYTTGKITINGDGKLWRPLIHVKDVVQAFVRVLYSPRKLIHNQVINVGATSQNFTISQVAQMVKNELPNTEIEYIPQNTDTRSYRVRCAKIKELLPEFDTKYSVQDGIRELVEVYRDFEAIIERDLTMEDLCGNKLVRLLHLKHLMETNQLDKGLRWIKN